MKKIVLSLNNFSKKLVYMYMHMHLISISMPAYTQRDMGTHTCTYCAHIALIPEEQTSTVFQPISRPHQNGRSTLFCLDLRIIISGAHWMFISGQIHVI